MVRHAYPPIGRQKFLAKLKPHLTPTELENVHAAYVFAKYGHRTQYRDGNKVRYFEHPKAVTWILINELHVRDWQTLVMALLHDVPEDTFLLTWNRIEINFGKTVTRGIKLLTKQPKRGYIARLKKFGDARVLLVKLADRLHNLLTLDTLTPAKREKQIIETLHVHIPLADLLIERLPRTQKWQGEYLKKELVRICTEETKRKKS